MGELAKPEGSTDWGVSLIDNHQRVRIERRELRAVLALAGGRPNGVSSRGHASLEGVGRTPASLGLSFRVRDCQLSTSTTKKRDLTMAWFDPLRAAGPPSRPPACVASLVPYSTPTRLVTSASDSDAASSRSRTLCYVAGQSSLGAGLRQSKHSTTNALASQRAVKGIGTGVSVRFAHP